LPNESRSTSRPASSIHCATSSHGRALRVAAGDPVRTVSAAERVEQREPFVHRHRRDHRAYADGVERLSEMTCVACRRDAPTVTAEEIAELSPQVPDWELVDVDGVPRLRRAFSFSNFADALAFTDAVGEIAEQEGHHPSSSPSGDGRP
jgi:hypothetical protein